MQDQHYTVGLTLEVEATNEQDALILAASAALEMQGRQGVRHCSMAVEALPLFDSQPFAQIRGQMGLGR